MVIPLVCGCAQTKLFLQNTFLPEPSATEETSEVPGSEEKIAKAGKKSKNEAAVVSLEDGLLAETLHDLEGAEKIYKQIIAVPDKKKFFEEEKNEEEKKKLATAYGRLAILSARRHDYETSEIMFNKSLELNPLDGEINGAYAQSLFEQERDDEAVTVATNALKMNKDDLRLYRILGASHLRQRRYQLGFRYLKQVYGEPEAYRRMAKAYYDHDNIDAANLAMKKHDTYYAKRGLTPPGKEAVAVHQEIPPQISVDSSVPSPYPQTAYSTPPRYVLPQGDSYQAHQTTAPSLQSSPTPPLYGQPQGIVASNALTPYYKPYPETSVVPAASNPLAKLGPQYNNSDKPPQNLREISVAPPVASEVKVTAESTIQYK
ncbi:MAG: hypothetical protein LBQ54_01540 [Planctomycetaceae bacterium]|nr:hypothetical protein [Planctomycetaceae bacterium]